MDSLRLSADTSPGRAARCRLKFILHPAKIRTDLEL
jgi:hypothetical protein